MAPPKATSWDEVLDHAAVVLPSRSIAAICATTFVLLEKTPQDAGRYHLFEVRLRLLERVIPLAPFLPEKSFGPKTI